MVSGLRLQTREESVEQEDLHCLHVCGWFAELVQRPRKKKENCERGNKRRLPTKDERIGPKSPAFRCAQQSCGRCRREDVFGTGSGLRGRRTGSQR